MSYNSRIGHVSQHYQQYQQFQQQYQSSDRSLAPLHAFSVRKTFDNGPQYQVPLHAFSVNKTSDVGSECIDPQYQTPLHVFSVNKTLDVGPECNIEQSVSDYCDQLSTSHDTSDYCDHSITSPDTPSELNTSGDTPPDDSVTYTSPYRSICQPYSVPLVNQVNTNIYCIVAADSRARDFESKLLPHPDLYTTKYIVRGGARINTLECEVLGYINKLPKTDIVILYILAGICELTYKEYHQGGVELCLHKNQNVYDHIVDLKNTIRRHHPLSLVGVATIPIIDFKKAQKHYKHSNQLFVPKYGNDDLLDMQRRLSKSLAKINTDLAHLNRSPQHLPGVGVFYPAHLFLHQDIEKDVVRKTKSSRKVLKRIPDKKLSDGVHASAEVADVWYEATHSNFFKLYKAIRGIDC